MGLFQKQDQWYIDYYYRGRRVRECVGPNKKAAMNALSTRKTEILQGRFSWTQHKKSPRFEDFEDQYMEYSKNNKRAWERDATAFVHLTPFFAKKRLNDITPRDVEAYKVA